MSRPKISLIIIIWTLFCFIIYTLCFSLAAYGEVYPMCQMENMFLNIASVLNIFEKDKLTFDETLLHLLHLLSQQFGVGLNNNYIPTYLIYI